MSDDKLFEIELTKIRKDFSDWISYVRTKVLYFCTTIFLINWAVFGSSSSGDKSFLLNMKNNYDIKRSLYCGILGILLILISAFIYALHLKVRDFSLQRDFKKFEELKKTPQFNDKEAIKKIKNEFMHRSNPNSSYPYMACVSVVSLVVDFLALTLTTFGFYYFFRACGFFA